MFWIIGAVLIQSAMTTSKPVASHKSHDLWRAYARCLSTKADALERSGASPDDIIKASETACAGEHTDAAEVFEQTFKNDPNSNPDDAGMRARRMLDQGMEPTRDAIRLKILETRAAQ